MHTNGFNAAHLETNSMYRTQTTELFCLTFTF